VAPLRLRRLVPADHEFVRRLSQAAFAEFARKPVALTLDMALRFHSYVAERAGETIGFAVVKLPRGRPAELTAIAVIERERGRGVGRSLLRAAEAAARRAGASSLTLHTADANLAAFELLHKQGYRLERRLPRYYVGVYDACQLVKRL
jgi:ribosomal protein S18 acetylase RimI-like enzyme